MDLDNLIALAKQKISGMSPEERMAQDKKMQQAMSFERAKPLISGYAAGKISPEEFFNGLKRLNFSTEQITDLMGQTLNFGTGAQKGPIGVPAPDGNTQVPAPLSSPPRPTLPSQQAVQMPANPPLPPRRIDVFGRNGGEPPYQVTPPTPAYSGRELGSTTASQMPLPSPAARAVATARQMAADRAPAPAAPLQTQEAPSGLMRLVRGDFREGADQRIMEAMRRQQEESGVQPSKAEGGAATGKGQNARDAALHKALEIIHMMLSRH